MKPRDEQPDNLAVLQQLLALHDGQLNDFQPTPPPAALKAYLRRADLHELQGLLVETLAAMRRVARRRQSQDGT